ncbi:MAG: hypothetical protein JXB45_00750 [Candidatus Krumholzibacteriota bacterium]|nr:hypothetical protein [Candidatus Krumholzibacteriota bacterium]
MNPAKLVIRKRLLTISLSSSLGICLLIGCASQKGAFDKACRANTIEAYGEYLSKYPTGEFADQSKEAIESIIFAGAGRENTVEAYRKYLKEYPQGKYQKEAKSRIEELSYAQARESNTIGAYQAFILGFPDSRRLEEVKRQVLTLELDNVRAGQEKTLCDAFIDKYGETEYAAEAVREVRELKERMVYEAAAGATTIEGALEYLSAYPRGEYADQLVQDIANKKLAFKCPDTRLLVTIPRVSRFHEIRYIDGEIDKPSPQEMFLTIEVLFINLGDPLTLSHKDIALVSENGYTWHPNWAFGFGWWQLFPGYSQRILDSAGTPGEIRIGRKASISWNAVAKTRDYGKVFLHLYGKRVGSLQQLAAKKE